MAGLGVVKCIRKSPHSFSDPMGLIPREQQWPIVLKGHLEASGLNNRLSHTKSFNEVPRPGFLSGFLCGSFGVHTTFIQQDEETKGLADPFTLNIGQNVQYTPTRHSIQTESASSRIDLLLTLDQIQTLRQEEDEEFLDPTEYAFSMAEELIKQAYFGNRVVFRRAAVTSDGNGGISIHWRQDEKKIALLIPSNDRKPARVYFNDGRSSNMINAQDASDLINALAWLDE